MHPGFEELRRRLARGPLVMGILNVTPDSFSDGGLWFDRRAAVDHALEMARLGADLVDIGGESTRPGALGVSEEEELDRVLPVLRDLKRADPGLLLSIDTQKARVARAAVNEGACLINDVSALAGDAAMPEMAAASGVGVCLMHRLEAPADAQWSPSEGSRYPQGGVTAEVTRFLKSRVDACLAAGIRPEALWVDPGLGFGKSVGDNLRLLSDLRWVSELGYPVLVGPSRKSFLGAALGGLPLEERLPATLAACVVALWQGASVLRVHDVKEAAQVAGLVSAMRRA